MPFDAGLAARVRAQLARRRGITERRMFGGLAFLLDGKMLCGVTRDDLMVRVGPDAQAEALALPGARPMDFTGKAMRGFVFVDADGTASDAALERWVARALAFGATLRAEAPGARKR